MPSLLAALLSLSSPVLALPADVFLPQADRVLPLDEYRSGDVLTDVDWIVDRAGGRLLDHRGAALGPVTPGVEVEVLPGARVLVVQAVTPYPEDRNRQNRLLALYEADGTVVVPWGEWALVEVSGPGLRVRAADAQGKARDHHTLIGPDGRVLAEGPAARVAYAAPLRGYWFTNMGTPPFQVVTFEGHVLGPFDQRLQVGMPKNLTSTGLYLKDRDTGDWGFLGTDGRWVVPPKQDSRDAVQEKVDKAKDKDRLDRSHLEANNARTKADAASAKQARIQAAARADAAAAYEAFQVAGQDGHPRQGLRHRDSGEIVLEPLHGDVQRVGNLWVAEAFETPETREQRLAQEAHDAALARPRERELAKAQRAIARIEAKEYGRPGIESSALSAMGKPRWASHHLVLEYLERQRGGPHFERRWEPRMTEWGVEEPVLVELVRVGGKRLGGFGVHDTGTSVEGLETELRIHRDADEYFIFTGGPYEGAVYKGQVRDGRAHGKGRFELPRDGAPCRVYSGVFDEGRLVEGGMSMKDAGIILRGRFASDRMRGSMTLLAANYQVEFEVGDDGRPWKPMTLVADDHRHAIAVSADGTVTPDPIEWTEEFSYGSRTYTAAVPGGLGRVFAALHANPRVIGERRSELQRLMREYAESLRD